MRKNNLSILRKFRALETRRTRAVEALTSDEPFLVGSLSLVNRTCGNPTCHCATRPGHPVWVLATTQDSGRRCQVVRVADVADVRRRVEAYKTFKVLRRELQAVHREIIALLRGLQEKRNVPYE